MRLRLFVAIVAGAGAAAAGIGLMAVSAWLISRAALHPPVLHLMVAIVAVRAFGIGRGALRYLERLAGHDAALRMLGGLRARVFAKLADLAPAGLGDFRRADLAQRMASDVDAVLDLITRVVLPYAVAAITGLGAVLLVGWFSPVAGWALAAGLLIVGLVVPLVQGRAARRSDARLAPLRARLATETVDVVHGMADLTAYGKMEARLDRLAGTDADLRRAERGSSASAGIAAAVSTLVTGLCVLAGLIAGAVAVRNGSIPGEVLAVIVLTPLAVFENASGLPAAAQKLAAVRVSLRRLSEVLRTPAPMTDPDQPVALPAGPHTLELDGVTAGWTPDRTVLRDFSLTLAPGSRVALVGPSGSGKSTIAALMVRFLDPEAGSVRLDGVDVRSLDPGALRSVVGYLPEDAYLFDSTIADNLRVARPSASPEELRSALAEARLLDWVSSLPQGMDTPVGEHGQSMSGGQRRRIALARALLAGFEILILDEPTEHLDDETAATLTRDLLRAAGGRTVLLITHRTDMAGEVDRVVSLDAAMA